MRDLSHRKLRGFSALELTVGVPLLTLVAALVAVSMEGARPGIQANAALEKLAAQVRTARELAIAEHHSYQVCLTAPDQIQLRRLEIASEYTDFLPEHLGNAVEFTLFPGLPDTPEGYGNARAISFKDTPAITFMSDGTALDATGAHANGTIFLGIPGRTQTARALAFQGATGRIVTYHWTGSAWEE